MLTCILAILSGAIGIGVALAVFFLNAESLSALGSILSGAAGLLAVIWFSASLRYQGKQLKEQREQFASQFLQLEETSRRDALLLAKGILDRAEERSIAQLGSGAAVADIFVEYGKLDGLKEVLESTDPAVVLSAYGRWMKAEGAAVTLMSGIKSAAEVYLRSVGAPGIDYSKPPEEFYFVNRALFESQPFFNSIAGIADSIAHFMVRLSPGRRSASIAFAAAIAKSANPGIVKLDTLKEDIAKHVADGCQLPAIADDF